MQFAKQLKSIPFPGFEMDVDVAMSDASSDFGSALNSPEAYHSRLASNVSTNSSGSVDNTPAGEYLRYALALYILRRAYGS